MSVFSSVHLVHSHLVTNGGDNFGAEPFLPILATDFLGAGRIRGKEKQRGEYLCVNKKRQDSRGDRNFQQASTECRKRLTKKMLHVFTVKLLDTLGLSALN